MQTHNVEVVSSNPARVTIKTQLVRKATRNHLVKSTSIEKTQSPVSGFCYAKIEYAMEFYENTTGEEGNGKPPHKIHFP